MPMLYNITFILPHGMNIEQFMLLLRDSGIDIEWVEPMTEDDEQNVYLISKFPKRDKIKRV